MFELCSILLIFLLSQIQTFHSIERTLLPSFQRLEYHMYRIKHSELPEYMYIAPEKMEQLNDIILASSSGLLEELTYFEVPEFVRVALCQAVVDGDHFYVGWFLLNHILTVTHEIGGYGCTAELFSFPRLDQGQILHHKLLDILGATPTCCKHSITDINSM